MLGRSKVAGLADKAENALDETRMLILGAQVLLGFNFQRTLEPGFERLPVDTQHVKLLGLGLMLVAVALLIAPSAYHQVVEHGNDSQRLIDFAGRIASLALLPFAFDIGIELYTATRSTLGPEFALPVGSAALAFALLFWYGLGWTWRARHETLVSAVEIVFLMSPAAFHRIVERGEDTERLHRFASTMVLAAMVPLALGIAGDFYIVLAKVLDSPSAAVALAIASLLLFYGLWFGLTLAIRNRVEASRGALKVSQAVR
jgi:hypothetical protein